MADAIQTLTDAVANITAVDTSAATLIQGIATQLAAHANDVGDDKLMGFAAALNASASALGAAVTANTVSAPAPAPAPAPASNAS